VWPRLLKLANQTSVPVAQSGLEVDDKKSMPIDTSDIAKKSNRLFTFGGAFISHV